MKLLDLIRKRGDFVEREERKLAGEAANAASASGLVHELGRAHLLNLVNNKLFIMACRIKYQVSNLLSYHWSEFVG